MVVELSESYAHNGCTERPARPDRKKIENIVLDLMKKNGIKDDQMQFKPDGTLQLTGTPNLKIHRIMLEAEELGLDMRYTKKTLIEIH